jgi:hypothetical protein
MRYSIFALLLLTIVIGCNYNNPQGRVAVRGEVTFDGKPLEQGSILFSSVAGTTPMVATGSLITNGKFSLPAEKGLIPDQTYSVRFRSVEEIPGTRKETIDSNTDPMMGIQTRSILPRRYGVESKETVTATKKSPNVFQFELTSKSDK